MTVLDIECPDCGRVESVRKEGLGRYECAECGREFSRADLTR
ncbi:hypothetical protein [Salarchaeum sp. JOR-1]|nr:hypothetical protein [Salarchaeum sp. JOR-1]